MRIFYYQGYFQQRGEGKREMDSIENGVSRNVGFAKRPCGLLRLSLPCDSRVGIVNFFAKGKIYVLKIY